MSRHATRSFQQLTNASLRSFSTVVDDRLAIAASASPFPQHQNVLQTALKATAPRHNWTRDEIREVYNTPLMELAHQSVCNSPSNCITQPSNMVVVQKLMRDT